ncbi:MAG: hypothetical protein JWO80_6231 [Bryobacterales bacterium]|nr:hypothetical protein [Bryobacterales bacterium]
MPNFDIAHVKEQGIDLIIVPLDSSFQHKTPNSSTTRLQSSRFTPGAELQGCCSRLGQ